jgi:hypothetical protein
MSFSPGGSGGSGAGGIASSNDVALNNAAGGQVLVYDSSVAKWRNGTNVVILNPLDPEPNPATLLNGTLVIRLSAEA